MKYFIDTEFLEDGKTIELISIGIVAEDGRELYLQNDEFDWDREAVTEWLQINVRRNLIPYYPQNTRREILNLILEFLANDNDIQFWGYFADYDWVVFCQLFGRMIDLPREFPYFCMDLKQLAKMKGVKIKQENSIHNALEDAKWIKENVLKLLNS